MKGGAYYGNERGGADGGPIGGQGVGGVPGPRHAGATAVGRVLEPGVSFGAVGDRVSGCHGRWPRRSRRASAGWRWALRRAVSSSGRLTRGINGRCRRSPHSCGHFMLWHWLQLPQDIGIQALTLPPGLRHNSAMHVGRHTHQKFPGEGLLRLFPASGAKL